MFWKSKSTTTTADIDARYDEAIAILNDGFRQSLGMSPSHNGTVLISEGVQALGAQAVGEILLQIARYDFTADEPYASERRRLGIIDGAHGKIAWRIYCYLDERQHVEIDGIDDRNHRVMEIGLASEILG